MPAVPVVSDERLRALERAARMGDPQAASALSVARARSGCGAGGHRWIRIGWTDWDDHDENEHPHAWCEACGEPAYLTHAVPSSVSEVLRSTLSVRISCDLGWAYVPQAP